MLNPPITHSTDLDAWLYDLNLRVTNSLNGAYQTTAATYEESGYPYQFIHIKYADDAVGTGFVNVPAFKMYWGIHNSALSTESTNPADYTWFKSPVGFGSLTFLYYQILGGRKIKFSLGTAQPSYKWLVDSGLAIDLESIVPPSTINFNEIMDGAVRELKIAANAVTATKINVAALDQALGGLRPNTVSAAQLADNAVTNLKILDGSISAAKTAIAAINPASGNLSVNSVTANAIQAGSITALKLEAGTITANEIATLTLVAGNIAAGAITALKIDTGAVTAEKIFAGAVTADKITVGNLAAISANMGAITAGSLAAVTITGSTITGNTINGGTINGAVINAGTLNAVDGNFSGTLTTTTPNAVNTTNLVGDAATVPSVDFRITQVSGNATYQTVGSLNLTLSHAGWVYCLFTANQSYGAGTKTSYLRLILNGSGTEVGGAAVTTNISVSVARYMAAGTYNVTASWWGEDANVRVNDTSLFVMGVKR